MLVGRTFRVKVVLYFSWKMALGSALLAAGVWAAYDLAGWTFVSIPFLPVATIGTAVAFYVGFKNNSSYDRLWEARRIWGAINNASRSWAVSVLELVGHRQAAGEPAAVREAARELVMRQIAWVNALRIQLRRPSALNASHADLPQIKAVQRFVEQTEGCSANLDRVLDEFVPADGAALRGQGNAALHLLHRQAAALAELKRRKWLDDYEHSDLMKFVLEAIAQQGAAERIKTFPFPRQYANFSVIFVRLFIFLLPFGLIRDMSTPWLVIPFSVVISWVFNTMEQVGDSSENPFENGINDVPMSAICRNIEIDLKELLGETELPARVQPSDGVLL